MKGMILSGMMGLCLLLGILAVLGSTWLVPTGDDAEEMEDAGMEQSYGLNTWNLAIDDVSSQYANMNQDGEEIEWSDDEKADMCKAMLEGYEDELDASGECDGESIELSWSISDACDSDMIDDDDEKEECDSTASALSLIHI